jgi:Pyridoxamine 5'-phosphate oxidase
MLETPEELVALQALLDESYDAAGPHMAEIITTEHRVDAEELCARLTGMRLLSVATVTADGRPLVGPVDGYFLHGAFHFSSAQQAVKIRHLAARPHLSAMHMPGEEFSVSVHGSGELYEVLDPSRGELRQAMLDHYLPTAGASFQEWLDGSSPVGVKINARRIFTYLMP